MTTKPASYARVRPLIDLDLGHAHQYGYRDHRFIPAKPGETWRPDAEQTRTTRTHEQESYS